MEQNKDQSGAAVRALPSDLTEREQITLLCQVETYMSITEKHSQTAPEAVAAETRMYSLVNGFIAKRFSDIGAAVRGEAVAESETTDLIELLRSIRPNYGAVGSRDVDVTAMRKKIDAAITILSARAADAPSEPTFVWIAGSKTFSQVFGSEEAARAFMSQFPPSVSGGISVTKALVIGKSRAADAPDSQPTDDKRDDLIARLRHQVDELNIRLADWESRNGPAAASSQPTDGGVRNG